MFYYWYIRWPLDLGVSKLGKNSSYTPALHGTYWTQGKSKFIPISSDPSYHNWVLTYPANYPYMPWLYAKNCICNKKPLSFMPTALLILLNTCLPSSCVLAEQNFINYLKPNLSTSLRQKLTSILNHSFLSLENVQTLCLVLYFHLPMIRTLSRGRCENTYSLVLANASDSVLELILQWGFFNYNFCWLKQVSLLYNKKNKKIKLTTYKLYTQ